MRKVMLTLATVLLSLGALAFGFGRMSSSFAADKHGFDLDDLKGSYSWKEIAYSLPFAQQLVIPAVYVFSADGAGNYSITSTGVTGLYELQRGQVFIQPNGLGFLSPTVTDTSSSTTCAPTGATFVLNRQGNGADLVVSLHCVSFLGIFNMNASVTLTKQ